LFIQKSIKDEKAEQRKKSGKMGKSGNFPQKAEEVATLDLIGILKIKY
jgi:hypothetical protein